MTTTATPNKPWRWFKRLSALSLGSAACLALSSLAAAGTRNWAGFRCAPDPQDGPSYIDFPQDFGPHFDYSLEWWYYTGNLKTVDGQDVGFHFTVVRRGLMPLKGAQAYMGNLALTVPQTGKGFYFAERYQIGNDHIIAPRDNFQIAMTQGQLWNVQALKGVPGYKGATFLIQGDATDKETGLPLGLMLTAVDTKGAVLQGNKGYSRKGEQACNASNYISQTRLEIDPTAGEQYLLVGNKRLQIASGTIWMDHEYSTSFTPHPGGGWDWFALKLDDRSELMFFHLRRSKNPYDFDPTLSSGAYIDPQGKLTVLHDNDFSIEVKGTWRSPATKVRYPMGWIVNLPKLGLELNINPLTKNQELYSPINDYWEGATLVKGSRHGEPLAGAGYSELVGYGKTFFMP